MSGYRLLPDGSGNRAPDGATDLRPKGQLSNYSGHVLVGYGSLGCDTGANHAECTTKRDENLGPDEREISVQELVNNWTCSRRTESYVAFLPRA